MLVAICHSTLANAAGTRWLTDPQLVRSLRRLFAVAPHLARLYSLESETIADILAIRRLSDELRSPRAQPAQDFFAL